MNRNTAIGLAAVALGLLLYIVFVEANALSTGELATQRGRLLETFVRERVGALALETPSGPIAFVRSRSSEGDEWDPWEMTAPVSDDVDEDAVDALLGQLEFASARRQVGEASDTERERFGLTDPVVSLTFSAGSQETTLRIGGEEPSGMGRYAEVSAEGDSRISIVGTDVFESLDQTAAHFRRKEVFRGYGPLRASRVQTGDVLLVRDENRDFWLEEPRRMANQDAARSLLEGLDGLRILSFADEAPSAGDFGLGDPAGQIRFERPALQEGETPVSTELRWGTACPSVDGQVPALHVRRDDGPVICVSEEALLALSPSREDLMETRFFHLRSESLSAVQVEGSGGNLTLSRTDDGWRLGEDAADEQALLDWLRDLRGQRFTAAEPISEPAPLTAYQLTFTDVDERAHSIGVGERTDGTFFAIRTGEPAILTFAPELGPLLKAVGRRFQNRRLVSREPASATGIRLERAQGATEEASMSGDSWRLDAPVDARTEPRIIDRLLRVISSLTVDGFAEVTRAEAGLTSPALTLQVDFAAEDSLHDHEGHEHGEQGTERAGPATVVLRFGAAVGTDRYAELDGESGVFLLSNTVFEQLSEPLISRRSLAFLAVDSVLIEQPGSRQKITRTQSGFETSSGQAADEERTTALLGLLGTLTSSSVSGYGGELDPQIRVEVTDPDGAVHTLRIEDRGTEASLAQREGLDVVFELDPTTVETIRDWRP